MVGQRRLGHIGFWFLQCLASLGHLGLLTKVLCVGCLAGIVFIRAFLNASRILFLLLNHWILSILMAVGHLMLDLGNLVTLSLYRMLIPV